MFDVFRAGVEPGGLTMDYEIKILICYILHQLNRPMPVSALIEVFVEEGIGNYFEVASAASSLLSNGHLQIEQCEQQPNYVITDVGRSTAESFEKKLPVTIRDKAVQAASRYFNKRTHRAQNKAEVRQVEDGFLLTLTITDIGSDLLSITILLPDQTICKEIQERFVQDPVMVYKGIVALLTGSFEHVGALLGEPQKHP